MLRGIGKFLGKLTILEFTFYGTPGLCVLRNNYLKSMFSAYYINERLYFQFFYLPEFSIKVNKKYAIDILNVIVFLPIAGYYYLNQKNQFGKLIFFIYLGYMIFIFFFTDAKKPQKKHKVEIIGEPPPKQLN